MADSAPTKTTTPKQRRSRPGIAIHGIACVNCRVGELRWGRDFKIACASCGLDAHPDDYMVTALRPVDRP